MSESANQRAGELEVHPDTGSLARAAAEHFAAQAAKATADRGRFLVALAGGATPRATYTLLAGGDFAPRVDWPRVHVFWGDERCVPPDHADSNYRMAREVLLDHVPIPAPNIHRIQGELPPERAAVVYEAEPEAVLGAEGRFDLILLGMGSDGHTASLFASTTALEEQERWVAANFVEKLDAWRVTLTLPAINAARTRFVKSQFEQQTHDKNGTESVFSARLHDNLPTIQPSLPFQAYAR